MVVESDAVPMSGVPRSVLFRQAVDQTAASCGLFQALERRAKRAVTILMYHRVLPDDQCGRYFHDNLVIPLSVFREQVKWLQSNYEVQTVHEVISKSTASAAGARVCITFDDGYWDNAEIAAPVLEASGLRGTFYLTTEFVEGRCALWFDQAAQVWEDDRTMVDRLCTELCAAVPATVEQWLNWLKGDKNARDLVAARLAAEPADTPHSALNRAMSVADARELAARGHELGAHSRTHPILTQLDDSALAAEVGGSLQSVRAWAGRPDVGFAYPNGSFDARVRAAVSSAGGTHACGTAPGLHALHDDVLAIRRRSIFPKSVSVAGKHSVASFRAEINGFHDLQRVGMRIVRRFTGRFS